MRTRIGLLVASVLLTPVLTVYCLSRLPPGRHLAQPFTGGSSFSPSAVPFIRSSVGPAFRGLPQICNVQMVELDGDGRTALLVCDAARNAVLAYRRRSDGSWDEAVIAGDLMAPAHATVVDIDKDGDRDIVVSVLGNIEPDDGVIGKLVLLERDGETYAPRVILDDVRRVADAQSADFDGDGDIDLAVAVFGYNRGQVLYLENAGEAGFVAHELHSAPGTIHVPVADYDGDGDPDIAAIVSQDDEELWGFENLGEGKFQSRRLYYTHNFDLGSAGLVQGDLDGDGDADLILPVGDNLEDLDAYPQPYHGCLWFENLGGWKFEPRPLATFGGTYAASVYDLDQDGDRDVVLVSMCNDWRRQTHGSLVWLENDGKQQFHPWQIDNTPSHLVTVDCGDIDGDGRPDIVAGGLHIRPPFDRLGRVTLWTAQGGKPQ